MRCSSITLNEINSDLKSGFAALKPLQINQAAVILSKIPAIKKRLFLPPDMPYLALSAGSVCTLGCITLLL